MGYTGVVAFLIRYGAVVGWVALALVAALCALGGVLLARRSVARRARAARDGLAGAALDPPELVDGRQVTLRGALEAPDTTASALDESGPVAAATLAEVRGRFGRHEVATDCGSVCGGELAVTTGERRVALVGPVRIVAGSHERLLGARLGSLRAPVVAALGERGAQLLEFGRGFAHVRSVRPGDAVLVRGVLRRVATGTSPEAHYREPGDVAWQLVPPESDAAVPIAFRGRPKIDVGWRVWLPALVVGLLGALGLVWGVGVVAEKVGWAQWALAATSPFHRAQALRHYRYELQSDERGLGKDGVEWLVTLHRMLDDCDGETETLLQHGQLRRAAERALACSGAMPDRQARGIVVRRGALARAMSAEFPEASDAADAALKLGALGREDQRFWVNVHLRAGRGARAAAAAEAYEPPADGDDETRMRCLADGLRARDGDEAARERLRASSHEACVVLDADGLEGDARLARLDAAASATSAAPAAARLARTAALLAAEAGRAPKGFEPASVPNLATHPVEILAGAAFGFDGLAYGVLERLAGQAALSSDERGLRANLAGYAAVFELAAGDAERAAHWAELAESDGETLRQTGGEPSTPRQAEGPVAKRFRARALRVLAALRAGEVERARSLFAPWQGASRPETADAFAQSQWPTRQQLAARGPGRADAYDEDVRLATRMLQLDIASAARTLAALLDFAASGSPDASDLLLAEHAFYGGDAHTTWLRVGEGDAETLVAWLYEERYAACPFAALLLGASRLGGAAFGDWLAYGQCARFRGVGVSRIREVAAVADIATSVGASDLAAAARAELARHRAGQLARELAVPLAVLGTLGPN